MRPFVRHYLNKYGAVPLWVLQNDLTYGNISHLYQLQKTWCSGNVEKVGVAPDPK